MRLKDKVAIVTGAGSGIGRGIAEVFAREGAQVVISEMNPVSGAEAVFQIEQSGGNAVFIQTDVSKESSVQNLMDEVQERWGQFDILVNNAGIMHVGKATETSLQDWSRVLDINLTGVFLCSKYAIRVMQKNSEGGSIVNISSVGGLVGAAELSAYAAAKAGVINLTRQLAADYGPDNIRCNCICPGMIVTPMQEYFFPTEDREKAFTEMAQQRPLRRLGTPEDIGYAALYLASDEAAFVSGAVLTVDGGMLAAGIG